MIYIKSLHAIVSHHLRGFPVMALKIETLPVQTRPAATLPLGIPGNHRLTAFENHSPRMCVSLPTGCENVDLLIVMS